VKTTPGPQAMCWTRAKAPAASQDGSGPTPASTDACGAMTRAAIAAARPRCQPAEPHVPHVVVEHQVRARPNRSASTSANYQYDCKRVSERAIQIAQDVSSGARVPSISPPLAVAPYIRAKARAVAIVNRWGDPAAWNSPFTRRQFATIQALMLGLPCDRREHTWQRVATDHS